MGDLLVHARIDLTSATGKEFRNIWSLTCQGQECLGAVVSVDSWIKGEPLGILSLNKIEVHVIEASSFGYVLKWGSHTFRVDLSGGKIELDEKSLDGTHIKGSAPCSSKGVTWPPEPSGKSHDVP
jgi:hypothetical protein